jgi:hypothetical protein
MRRVSQVVETAIHVAPAPPVIRIVTAEQSGPAFTVSPPSRDSRFDLVAALAGRRRTSSLASA